MTRFKKFAPHRITPNGLTNAIGRKGQMYLGWGSLEFSYRRAGGTIKLLFKGVEVATSCTVGFVAYQVLGAQASLWSNWYPHPSGQTDCDVRDQFTRLALKDGQTAFVTATTNQVEVTYQFSFHNGRLRWREVACHWFGGGPSCLAWTLSEQEASEEAYNAFFASL